MVGVDGELSNKSLSKLQKATSEEEVWQRYIESITAQPAQPVLAMAGQYNLYIFFLSSSTFRSRNVTVLILRNELWSNSFPKVYTCFKTNSQKRSSENLSNVGIQYPPFHPYFKI